MSHLIAKETALHFVHHYQRLLMEVVAHPTFPKPQSGKVQYLSLLTQARGFLLEHPQVLHDALAALRKAQTPLPADVEHAVRSMRAGSWVYLRDTAHYSILLAMTVHEHPEAYAVKSLTTRLRDMTGCSGLVLETALMEYAGCIATDGLIGTVAHLGSGYRESYGEYLAQAKALGRFHPKQLATAPMPIQPLITKTPRPIGKKSIPSKTAKKS